MSRKAVVDEVRVARTRRKLAALREAHPEAFAPDRLPSTPAALAEALGEKRTGRPPIAVADRMLMMSVRMPRALLMAFDAARGDRSRGQIVRLVLAKWVRSERRRP